MKTKQMKINWFYENREERSLWLTKRFSEVFANSKTILDVGCYNADLKKHIDSNAEYTGIDIAGKPDIKMDLDAIDKLPFPDKSFDLTVCADTLEHLENIHLIFDEICRVSKKYIVLTLPNAMSAFPEILKGKKYAKTPEQTKQYGMWMKFYGLPHEKPIDRHRWFFSYDEAGQFIYYRSEKFNFQVISEESEHKYTKASLRKFVLNILGLINSNFINRNYICLLEKKENS